MEKQFATKDLLAYLLEKGNKAITDKNSTKKDYREVVIDMMFILTGIYEKQNSNADLVTVVYPSLQEKQEEHIPKG